MIVQQFLSAVPVLRLDEGWVAFQKYLYYSSMRDILPKRLSSRELLQSHQQSLHRASALARSAAP